jgi:hypothetical protein
MLSRTIGGDDQCRNLVRMMCVYGSDELSFCVERNVMCMLWKRNLSERERPTERASERARENMVKAAEFCNYAARLLLIRRPLSGPVYTPNITQPNTLKCGAEFDAAPMRLREVRMPAPVGPFFWPLPVLAP